MHRAKFVTVALFVEVSLSLNKLNLRWWGRKSVINENHYKTILKNTPRSSSFQANNSWRKWLQSSLFMHNWAERKLKNYRNSTSPICMTVLAANNERESEKGKMKIVKSISWSLRMFIAYLSQLLHSAKFAR